MIKELIKLANHLDSKGLVKEADYLDRIIKNADTTPISRGGPVKGNVMLTNEESDVLTEILSKEIRNAFGSNVELSTVHSKDTGALYGGGHIYHTVKIEGESIYDIIKHPPSQEAIIEIDGKFFQKFRPKYRPFDMKWLLNDRADGQVTFDIVYDWTENPVDMYYKGYGE